MRPGSWFPRRLAGEPRLLLAAIVLLCVPAAAAGQGLKLGDAEEKVVETLDRPNPHFGFACSECHEGSPVRGRDTAQTVKFVNGEAGNVDLCHRCHDAADNIHPVNMDPRAATPPLEVPDFLPLERRGGRQGTVVCSTCHFIHARTAGLRLLRGFPESSDPREIERARFKDRRDLCKSCHGAGLQAKTPHQGKAGQTRTCTFCHSVTPREGEKVELTQGLVQVCDFCHGATKGAHYLLVNPFADPTLREEVAGSGLPRQGGDYTCISCHNPHGGTGEPKFLRAEFVDLALKSRRVRPHYLTSFCRACHQTSPRAPRGSPEAQPLAEIPLREGDPNALCNRCHASGLSKANAHPLRRVSEKYRARIPEGWPLYQGSLTCLTCHSAGDSPFYDPGNPSFLRGGPYESRNEICWKCHQHEELAQLNPHRDVNSGQGCEFCHDTKPDVKKSLDVRQFRFKGDIVMLCLRCHTDAEHPASRNHNGLPDEERMARINIAIPDSFPLDAEGRVHCATCHDPHVGAQGTIRGVSVGMEICPLCHKWGERSDPDGEDASAAGRGVAAPPAAVAAARTAADLKTIVRQHLDAGRVQYTGMDINADGFADSIRVDRIKQTLIYFAGDRDQSFRAFDPSTLAEGDQRFAPDVLLDQDLDGDEISDLLLFNRGYLARYRANESTVERILSAGVYLGQPRGAFIALDAAAPTDEARARILDRARTLALPAP